MKKELDRFDSLIVHCCDSSYLLDDPLDIDTFSEEFDLRMRSHHKNRCHQYFLHYCVLQIWSWSFFHMFNNPTTNVFNNDRLFQPGKKWVKNR